MSMMIKKLLAKFLATMLVIICKLVTGIQARWFNQPSNTVTVYFANHTSHLDGLVLWSSFPKQLRKAIHPVAAKDYWGKTALRKFIAIDVFNSVLINRHATPAENPLQPLETILENQQSLILFPEGTRGSGEQIADFKPGLYHIAKKFPDVKLVPVYLNNLNRVLPKGSKLVVPIICSAVFGAAIEPLSDDETKTDFLIRAKQSLEDLVS